MKTGVIQKRRDQEVLAFAKQYLLDLPGVTAEILDRHISPTLERPAELSCLFQK